MAASGVSRAGGVEFRLVAITNPVPDSSYFLRFLHTNLPNGVVAIVNPQSLVISHPSLVIPTDGTAKEGPPSSILGALTVTVIELPNEPVDSRAQRIQGVFGSKDDSTPRVTFTNRPTVGQSSVPGLTLNKSPNGQWEGTWSEIVTQENPNLERPHGRLSSDVNGGEKFLPGNLNLCARRFVNRYLEALRMMPQGIVMGGTFEPDPTLAGGPLEAIEERFLQLIKRHTDNQDPNTPPEQIYHGLLDLMQLMEMIIRKEGVPSIQTLGEMWLLAQTPLPFGGVRAEPPSGLSLSLPKSSIERHLHPFSLSFARYVSNQPTLGKGATDQQQEAFSSGKEKLAELLREREQATEAAANLEGEINALNQKIIELQERHREIGRKIDELIRLSKDNTYSLLLQQIQQMATEKLLEGSRQLAEDWSRMQDRFGRLVKEREQSLLGLFELDRMIAYQIGGMIGHFDEPTSSYWMNRLRHNSN